MLFTQTLLLKLDTLKRQIRRHIPLLRLLRKALPVVIEKQPSLTERRKGIRQRVRIERLSWQYWYDSVDLISMILSASQLRDKMFIDMTEYVDESTELWHSSTWDSSIRATSGDVCYTRQEDLIISEDLVQIDDIGDMTRGRVTFIGRDYRADALKLEEIIVTLQHIADNFDPILRDFALSLEDLNELFLIENKIVELFL